MTTANPFLELLETNRGTLEQAVEAIHAFESELAESRPIDTSTCSFCGRAYVVQPGDRPVVRGQGRRSLCWRPGCRQALRAYGLEWAGHYLHRGRQEPRPRQLKLARH
jgi:hypothetical protein